jgi:hypothetical protein
MVFLMQKTTLVLSLGLFFSSFISVFGQDDFARIEKNRNFRAEGLYHDLNKTKDTLLLRSNSKIGYVYSINGDYKREIDTYIFDYECKIPLTNLSKGKHVFAVGHMSMAVVFVVHKYQEKIVPELEIVKKEPLINNSEASDLEVKVIGEIVSKSNR